MTFAEETPGLVFCGTHRSQGTDVAQQKYQFAPSATAETCHVLLERVSSTCELVFFDAAHPQLSDPGAYVSVVRSPDGLLAMCGNHGWSTSWVPVSPDEVLRYLVVCIPYSTAPSGEEVLLVEPSNWRRRGRTSRWRWASFRRYLNKRLAGAA